MLPFLWHEDIRNVMCVAPRFGNAARSDVIRYETMRHTLVSNRTTSIPRWQETDRPSISGSLGWTSILVACGDPSVATWHIFLEQHRRLHRVSRLSACVVPAGCVLFCFVLCRQCCWHPRRRTQRKFTTSSCRTGISSPCFRRLERDRRWLHIHSYRGNTLTLCLRSRTLDVRRSRRSLRQ